MKCFDPRIRFPKFFTGLFPDSLWRGSSDEKKVYLTFDDGPIPEVTPWVLDLLKKENISACFFCVGENVKRNPQVFRQIIESGHLVGNHTYHHVQGLKVSDEEYRKNVEDADSLINSVFFRPPHGLMKKSQYKWLCQHYHIIMWDLVSCDYRQDWEPARIIHNVINYVRPGSIITFHDSLKAERNMRQSLPVVIKELKSRGYRFGRLDQLTGMACKKVIKNK